MKLLATLKPLLRLTLILAAPLATTSCSILTRFKDVPDGTTLDPPSVAMEECAETVKAKVGDDARVIATQRGAQNEICRFKHAVLIDYVEKKQAERSKKNKP